jgi:SAM-dependent methyltransferase
LSSLPGPPKLAATGTQPVEPKESAMDETAMDQKFWEARYQESERIWSGRPNAALVRETAGLVPGRALELGCGEGADAVWLAEQGWQVTAADISAVALGRAAAHAASAGLADRIDWQQHVLGETFPAGAFDLVTALYLHGVGDRPRELILRPAADAVAPGGTLLIVSHAGSPHGDSADHHADRHPAERFPTPREVLASLELPDGAWDVLRCEEHDTPQTRPDLGSGTRRDGTVKVRRRAA